MSQVRTSRQAALRFNKYQMFSMQTTYLISKLSFEIQVWNTPPHRAGLADLWQPS